MDFFNEQAEASLVKSRIVTKYFCAWYKIILPTASQGDGRIAYIDLFAGPGRFEDGSISTPLMVLEEAINNPPLARSLVSIFNDGDEKNAGRLSAEIASLSGIEELRFAPQVLCGDVDASLIEQIERVRLVPTFSFIDPFGYKGLTMAAIKSVIRDWGCDCVFFFNYNRINAGISNPFVKTHMDKLFGEDRAQRLREKLNDDKSTLTPALREALILEELVKELRELGAKYALPFTFMNERGTRTSHKLIFVTKHFKGYDVMKSIMAAESSTDEEGVASFKYSPADERMPLLFSLNQPYSKFREELPRRFAGRSLTLDQLYEIDSVDRPFMRKHYTTVMRELEAAGRVSAFSTTGKRRSGTYPAHVMIAFPSGSI